MTGAILRWEVQRRWVEPVLLGGALGLGLVALQRAGLWPPLWELALRSTRGLHRTVGPVWIPMALAGTRVAWLAIRALLTRAGRGRLGAPVRPELGQIAPVFAALGLCGTVWGLSIAFEALNGGQFLEQLPLLLGGLGAAMTSTLVGLGLQIATLLVALVNPAWSRLEVGWSDGRTHLELDRRAVPDVETAVSALRARTPEALCVAFAPRVPAAERRAIASLVWSQLDAAVRLREVEL